MTFLTELRQEVKVGNEVQLVKSMITKLMQFKTYGGGAENIILRQMLPSNGCLEEINSPQVFVLFFFSFCCAGP